MNSITTNAYSNVVKSDTNYSVTLNATLNSKDHAILIIGFVAIPGNGGDPKIGDEGARYPGAISGDRPIGNYSSSSVPIPFYYDTIYRVAAVAVDGTTSEIFYGETVRFNISKNAAGEGEGLPEFRGVNLSGGHGPKFKGANL